MKVLVIGSGGREHCIVSKISESPKVKKIYAIPGNGGIYHHAECFPEFNYEKDLNKIKDFAIKNNIDLTIVGPEDPLAAGIVDLFEKNKLKIFGPSKKAAQIEASKSFAKKIMYKMNIPTGKAEIFVNYKDAINYLKNLKTFPVVIKADGLAKGKGVSIVKNLKEAKDILDKIMNKKIFGNAGNKVLIEEFLEGEELTILAFTDGKTIKIMPPARDYKRLLDKNKGPNTGGMGAFAPVKISNEDLNFIINKILYPVIEGLKNEGIIYKGVLYAGLIKTNEGFKVLEFNCRFGDPEAQVILPLLKTDLIDIIEAVINQKLDEIKIKWLKKKAVLVVAASNGYPYEYKKYQRITGINDVKKVKIFHAGTVIQNNVLLTNGGRVLNVVGISKSFEKARKIVYENLKLINFNGMIYRNDICE
jgi:phosphoribosylamine--glycine ligase